MKRCPECRRDYFDDSLLYCLDDGSELLEGPGSGSEPRTAILHSVTDADEGPTRPQVIPSTDITAPRRLGTTQLAIAGSVLLLLVAGFTAYRLSASASAGVGQINSIAVLPFENRSGNGDTDYLSDGLADSLIFRLSQLPGLKVSPTSSVLHYKGGAADVAQVAKELDVDAVLSGRLLQVGDQLSISVQLVDARSKKVLWAEQYDRKMSDLLATQREIAGTIVQKLQLKLSGDETGLTKKYTSSNEAYQLYLKGRYYWGKRSKNEMFVAVDSYKKAIELDPNFALAYAALAEVYLSMAKDPDVSPKDSVPFAKTAAMRALELDPSLPEAHSAFGDALAIYDWNWPEAGRELTRALELDPNIGYIHLVYSGSYLGPIGKADDAVKEAERAVQLEPLSMINNSVLTSSYIYARQYDKAIAQGRHTVDLDPSFPLSRYWLAVGYIATKQFDTAIAVANETPRDSPAYAMSLVALGQAYAAIGNRAEAERRIAELRDIAATRYVRRYYFALIYAGLGDKEKAFEELERCFEERDAFISRMSTDPFMDPLRGDPRFADLIRRMGLPQAQ